MLTFNNFIKNSEYPVLDINDALNFYNELLASLPDDEDTKICLTCFLKMLWIMLVSEKNGILWNEKKG